MRKSVAVVLSFLMLAAPACADVIGSRPGGNAKKERAQVQGQLEKLGVHPEAAKRKVSNLSADDVEFFASNPGTIMLAGAQEGGGQGEFFSGSSHVRWYEFVGGAALLVGTIVGVVVAVNNNE
jgi:hypothetical protein